MSFEIKICAVGNPFEFAPMSSGKFKFVFDVRCAFGIMRQLLFGVFVNSQAIFVNSKILVPSQARINPIL